jgi:hypothetical protein
VDYWSAFSETAKAISLRMTALHVLIKSLEADLHLSGRQRSNELHCHERPTCDHRFIPSRMAAVENPSARGEARPVSRHRGSFSLVAL